MKYKVGDKVKVREWDDMEDEFGLDRDGDIKCTVCFSQGMKKYCGKVLAVEEINEERHIYRLEEVRRYVFSDDMLLPACKFKVGDKVIGNDKAKWYVHTTKGVVVTVIDTDEGTTNDIKVRIEDGRSWWVSSERFDLYKEGDNPKPTEFKVGDRVKHEKGVGTIVFAEDDDDGLPIAVEFDKNVKGHTCNGHAKSGHGWWCCAKELTKIEDTPRENPEGEWRVVDREPKSGDYIRLRSKGGFTFNRVGDILRVHRTICNGVKVKCRDHARPKEVVEKGGCDLEHEWTYTRAEYEVVERVGDDSKRAHTVLIDEPAKPRSEFYNGKVVCIAKCSPSVAYTVGKVYEFIDGRVKIDNGNIVPHIDKPVKSIEDFDERCGMFAKFAPLIEDTEDGFTPHLECFGNDYGKLGQPTKFTDRDGNALLIGDIVRISSAGMTVDSVVCTEGKAAFIMGIESACNEEKNTFGEWSVRKVRPWQEVEDRTVCARVRFIKTPKD